MSIKDWRLRKESRAIQIYTRKMENSRFDSYQARTVLNTDLTTATNYLFEPQNLENWLYPVDKAILIDQKIAETNYAHVKFNFPWPVKKRDFVTKMHLHENNADSKRIIWTPANHLVEESKSYVRMLDFELDLSLEQIDSNKTRLSFTGFIEFGGDFPSKVYNLLVVEGPYQNMKSLRKALA